MLESVLRHNRYTLLQSELSSLMSAGTRSSGQRETTLLYKGTDYPSQMEPTRAFVGDFIEERGPHKIQKKTMIEHVQNEPLEVVKLAQIFMASHFQ